MTMRHLIYLIVLALLLVTLTACGAGPTATPTPKPTVAASPTLPPTPVPPPPPPTPTPIPPTPVPPTPTPMPPQATTKQQVNVRKGPGVQFEIAGKLPANSTSVILGKNEDGKWLQIAFPDPSKPGWVSTAFVTVTGTLDQTPVVAVAPPPTPTRGAVATKAPAATATQVFPPPRGGVAFVSLDPNWAYVVNHVRVDSRAVAGGFMPLGTQPFDIKHSTSAAPFAWSPNTTLLAYVFGPSGDPRNTPNILQVVRPDGTRYSDPATHTCISSPVWLPDNRTIVYIGMDGEACTGQAIYKIRADGTKPEDYRFFPARPGESLRGLAWGKWLLFVSNLSGAQEIWRLNLDRSDPTQLTTDKRENGAPAWNPDSTRFAYYSKQPDGSYQIMVANADGSNPRKLTNQGNNFTPTWSPDGNWIAFTSDRGGRFDIYIMDRNGGNVQVLTDKYGPGGMLPGSWR